MAANKPMTDKKWREEFILRLRVLDVPGPVVGEQLKLADDHAADAGQSHIEAFGDPAEYADTLGKQLDLSSPTRVSGLAAIGIGAFLGMGLIAEGFGAAMSAAPVQILLGDVVLAVIVVALVVGAFELTRRIGRFGLCMALMLLFIIGASIVSRVVPAIILLTLPWWLALGGGAALIAAVFYSLRSTVQQNRVADPVTGKSML